MYGVGLSATYVKLACYLHEERGLQRVLPLKVRMAKICSSYFDEIWREKGNEYCEI
jgi:hypothetical protein